MSMREKERKRRKGDQLEERFTNKKRNTIQKMRERIIKIETEIDRKE